jgi:competence protein ComGC
MKKIFFSLSKNDKGYTLVELLLYFALVSLLFIQLTSLFITVLEAKQDAHATSAVERDGQFILARMAYDIQRASAVTTPASLGQQSSQLQLTINGTSYTYHVVNNKLYLTRGAEELLLSATTEAANFTVLRVGNLGGKHTLKISFDSISQIQEAEGKETRTYQTTVGLR